jgi:hypothetical protein
MADDDKSPFKRVSAKRGKIISYVKSPLGFYCLALLIVESFLLGSGVFFNLSETIRITTIVVGVVLFLVVVGTVTFLAVKFPHALVFSEESHIEWEYLHVFGDSARPIPEKSIVVLPGGEPPDRPNQPTSGGGGK